jgi:chemotaxis protein methyltransferase CheR
MAISREDFQFVSGYLHKEAGIALSDEKAYLVENRLGELCRSLGMDSIASLVRELRAFPQGKVRQPMVEAMTTNETSFFRDITPFEAMRSTLVPELLEARKACKRLRIWSAASSTGQESYSISMLLDFSFRRMLQDWIVEIVGSDLAEKVLERCREGEYSQLEVNRGLPAQYLMTYFKKKASRWQLIEPIKKPVSFERVNLLDIPARLGNFDVIFCRNVLIYFDQETKRRVLQGLRRQLRPDGYLIVGASEVLSGVTDIYQRCHKGGAVVYKPV